MHCERSRDARNQGVSRDRGWGWMTRRRRAALCLGGRSHATVSIVRVDCELSAMILSDCGLQSRGRFGCRSLEGCCFQSGCLPLSASWRLVALAVQLAVALMRVTIGGLAGVPTVLSIRQARQQPILLQDPRSIADKVCVPMQVFGHWIETNSLQALTNKIPVRGTISVHHVFLPEQFQ